MMDVVLECPLEEIVAELAVSDDVRGTLLGRESPLRPVYDLVLAYERADWRSVTRLSEPCGMTEATVAGAYMQAVRWNQRTFQGGPAEPAAARA
jgi:EAL and modified HD-GYP domain-containing signal transduction protein